MFVVDNQQLTIFTCFFILFVSFSFEHLKKNGKSENSISYGS